MGKSLIQKMQLMLATKKEQIIQNKINRAFKREICVYDEIQSYLANLDFSSDIVYHISERSQNILYLLEHTSMDYEVSRDFLNNLNIGLTIDQKIELIKILKSNQNIKFNEDDSKVLRLDWQNNKIQPAQKIGTRPIRIIISYEGY